MSYTARLMPGTSLTIRLDMASRTSCDSLAQSAVIRPHCGRLEQPARSSMCARRP